MPAAVPQSGAASRSELTAEEKAHVLRAIEPRPRAEEPASPTKGRPAAYAGAQH